MLVTAVESATAIPSASPISLGDLEQVPDDLPAPDGLADQSLERRSRLRCCVIL
jgi:hypothetical protein